MTYAATIESGSALAPREHSRRSRHKRRRHARRVGHASMGSELKAWLKLLDTVLVGVEKTAWSVRGLADDVREAWQLSEGDLDGLREELTGSSKGLVRLTRTGFVLGQIAASYRLYGLRAAFMSRSAAERLLTRLHEQNAQRFYEACIEHGGAFLKVGQVLSARPDLMPESWVSELSQLQDAAPMLPMEAVQRVLEAELGQPLGEAFASFEPEPIAAASIGQVHKAVTHDGQHVAVKVQRPGIEALVRADLKTLEVFLSSMRSSLPQVDYETIVSELRGAVLSELDYFEEAHNTRIVGDAFADDPRIVVPRPVAKLCTGRVLTTTFITGRKITDVLDEAHARAQQGDEPAQSELSHVLGLLLEAYLRQIFISGTFQADPHPGNILVTQEGQVVILDFGCSKTLVPAVKAGYVELVRAFMMSERERTGQLLLQLGFATRSGRPDTLMAFADAILHEFQQALQNGSFAFPDKRELSARATRLLAACEDDPVSSIPSEFVLIARVLTTLGGLFSHYEPDILFAEHVMPVLGSVLFSTPATTDTATTGDLS